MRSFNKKKKPKTPSSFMTSIPFSLKISQDLGVFKINVKISVIAKTMAKENKEEGEHRTDIPIIGVSGEWAKGLRKLGLVRPSHPEHAMKKSPAPRFPLYWAHVNIIPIPLDPHVNFLGFASSCPLPVHCPMNMTLLSARIRSCLSPCSGT